MRLMSVPLKQEDIFEICAAIFNEVADAVYVCDPEGKMLFLNKAAERLDGIRLE